LLLVKDIGDVVGTECASRMSFTESSSNGIRTVFSDKKKQLANLSGKRTIGIGKTS